MQVSCGGNPNPTRETTSPLKVVYIEKQCHIGSIPGSGRFVRWVFSQKIPYPIPVSSRKVLKVAREPRFSEKWLAETCDKSRFKSAVQDETPGRIWGYVALGVRD